MRGCTFWLVSQAGLGRGCQQPWPLDMGQGVVLIHCRVEGFFDRVAMLPTVSPGCRALLHKHPWPALAAAALFARRLLTWLLVSSCVNHDPSACII